jgi:hypothetical protein
MRNGAPQSMFFKRKMFPREGNSDNRASNRPGDSTKQSDIMIQKDERSRIWRRFKTREWRRLCREPLQHCIFFKE